MTAEIIAVLPSSPYQSIERDDPVRLRKASRPHSLTKWTTFFQPNLRKTFRGDGAVPTAALHVEEPSACRYIAARALRDERDLCSPVREAVCERWSDLVRRAVQPSPHSRLRGQADTKCR